MKKSLLILSVLSLGACAELSSFMPSNSDSSNSSGTRAKMQSCLLNEAQNRFQTGTLFNDTITATAKDLVGTCTKKLALSSIGISDEAQKSAENIIANLRNMNSN